MCDNCGAENLILVSSRKNSYAKDLRQGKGYIDGDIPEDLGVGCGKNVEFVFCTICGKIQGEFPKNHKELGIKT